MPAVVRPTQAERAVLREVLPAFYIRFTAQQEQIMKARGEYPR